MVTEIQKKIAIFFWISENISNFLSFQYFFMKFSVRSELVVKRSNPGIYQHSIKYFGWVVQIPEKIFFEKIKKVLKMRSLET